MTGIDGVIFDCDGVLFESHQANLAYYNAVLEKLGEPPVLAEQRERAHLCHTAASPVVFDGLLGRERVDALSDLCLDFLQHRVPSGIGADGGEDPKLQSALSLQLLRSGTVCLQDQFTLGEEDLIARDGGSRKQDDEGDVRRSSGRDGADRDGQRLCESRYENPARGRRATRRRVL